MDGTPCMLVPGGFTVPQQIRRKNKGWGRKHCSIDLLDAVKRFMLDMHGVVMSNSVYFFRSNVSSPILYFCDGFVAAL